MTSPALEIRGLYKRFDSGSWILEDLNLDVREGELLYLLGPSGSGKTTLLRLICGFDTPTHGEVLARGRTISLPGRALPPDQRDIGLVFQDYAIFPHLTVKANVSFGLAPPFYQRWLSQLSSWVGGDNSKRSHARQQKLQGVELKARLDELFALTGLTGLEQRYPHELSGGQQQRVALARALAADPAVILLDEPFSNLDTALRHRIRREVRTVLRKSGATSILVTHDQEEAISLADRIAVINQGKLEQLGTPDELLHAPKSRFVATFVGLSDFIRGTVKGKKVETELGNFPLPKTPDTPKSGEVDVLLRPDHFFPAKKGKGTPAKVVDVEYMGIQTLFTLALPSGTTIQALFPGHPDLAAGEEICISFEPPELVVFPVK